MSGSSAFQALHQLAADKLHQEGLAVGQVQDVLHGSGGIDRREAIDRLLNQVAPVAPLRLHRLFELLVFIQAEQQRALPQRALHLVELLLKGRVGVFEQVLRVYWGQVLPPVAPDLIEHALRNALQKPVGPLRRCHTLKVEEGGRNAAAAPAQQPLTISRCTSNRAAMVVIRSARFWFARWQQRFKCLPLLIR
jgi:hypothetical protein